MTYTPEPQQQTDERLIGLFLAGNRAAFSELVSRYQNRIYNLSFRYLGSSQDAEDVTQEIFVSLLHKMKGFRGEAKFSTWLYRIASNRCLDFLRARKPFSTPLDEVDPPGGDSPEPLILSKIDMNELLELLSGLSADYKAAVVLRDIEGLTYEEISSVLEITMGTVKSRINRGRRVIAAEILKRRSEEGQQVGAEQI